MSLSDMTALLAEVNHALGDYIQWVEDRVTMKEHGAVAYIGRVLQNDGGGWVITLVEYPLEDGSGRHEVTGTAARLGTIVRLPRDLAAKALKAAKHIGPS